MKRSMLTALFCLLVLQTYGQVDVNNDSIPDPLFYTTGYDETNPSAGSVIIQNGDTGFPLYTLTGQVTNDGFGYRAVYGPDLTGDGVPEVLVSVPLASCGGGACSSEVRLLDPTNGVVVRAHTAPANQVTGLSLASLGDVDGDGYDDYAIESASSNPRKKSGIYTTIYSGATGASLLEYQCSAAALARSVAAGSFLILAEDVDLDGDVDDDDVNQVISDVGQTGPDLVSDIDSDGIVDEFDLELVVSAIGDTAYLGQAHGGANTGFCGHFGGDSPCGGLSSLDSCGGQGGTGCAVFIDASPIAQCEPTAGPVFWGSTLYLSALVFPYCGSSTAGCTVDWYVTINQPGGTRVETYSGFSWRLDDVQGNVDIYAEYTWIDQDDIACCIASDELYLTQVDDSNNNGIPDPCDASTNNSDDDGDTYFNICESLLGYDPQSADSFPLLAPDSDGDGLSDLIETCQLGTNRYRFDTDNDGVDDYAEIKMGTDPLLEDTDGDTVLDRYEDEHVLGDLDEDGISDMLERAKGWDPANPDQDFDGIVDGTEIRWGLDPTSPRGFLRTNPSRHDPDSDRLFTHLEYINGTDPNNFDSDSDSLSDRFEAEYRLAINISPTDSDTDDDGIPDGMEDGDGDGLTNFEEDLLGTDPSNSDTDGDGLSDKYEVDTGLDPIHPFIDSDGDTQPDLDLTDTVFVTIGDPSGSHSERWFLRVGATPARSPGWGEVTNPPVRLMLRRGEKHGVRLHHISTDPSYLLSHGNKPDYDYLAEIETSEPYYIADPDDLLGRHDNIFPCDGPGQPDCDYFSPKRAILYFPFDCGEYVTIDGPGAVGVDDIGDSSNPAGSLFKLNVPSYIADPVSIQWSIEGPDAASVVLTPEAIDEVWAGPASASVEPGVFTLRATVVFPGNEHCGEGNQLHETVTEIIEKQIYLIRVDVAPDSSTHDAVDVADDVLSVLPLDTEEFSYIVEPSGYTGDITFTSLDPTVAMFNLGNGVYQQTVTVSAVGGEAVSVFGNKESGSTVIGCGVPGDTDTGVCGSNLSVLVGGKIEFDMVGMPTFVTPDQDLTGWTPPALADVPDIGDPPAVSDTVPFRDPTIDPSTPSILQAKPDSVHPLSPEFIARANSDTRFSSAYMRITVYDSRGKPKKNRPVVIYAHYDRLQFFSIGGGGVPPGLAYLTTDFTTDSDGRVKLGVRGDLDITDIPALTDVNGQPLPLQAFTLTSDQLAIGVGEGIRDYFLNPNLDITHPVFQESFTGDRVSIYPNKISFIDEIQLEPGDQTLNYEDLVFVTRIPIASQAALVNVMQGLTSEAAFPYDISDPYSYDSAPLLFDIYDANLDATVAKSIENLQFWESLGGPGAGYAEMVPLLHDRWNTFDYTVDYSAIPDYSFTEQYFDALTVYFGNVIVYGWEFSSAGDITDIVYEGVYVVYFTDREPDIIKLAIAEASLAADITAPLYGSVLSSTIKIAILKALKESPALRKALTALVGTGVGSVRNFIESLLHRYPLDSADLADPALIQANLKRAVEGIVNESKALDAAPFVRSASSAVKDDVQQGFLRLSLSKSTGGNRLWEGAIAPRAMHGIGAHAAKRPTTGMVLNQSVAFRIRDAAGMTALRSRKSFENIQTAIGNGYNRLLTAVGSELDRFISRVDDALEAARKSANDLGPTALRDSVSTNYIGDGKVFESVHEFEAIRFMEPEDMTQAQIAALRNIRDNIPNPTVGARVQRVVALDDQIFNPTAMIQNNQSAIAGFIGRSQDLPSTSPTTKELIDRFRLDYPASGLSNTSPHAIIETRMTGDMVSNITVPRKSQFGGNYDIEYPYTGNGFTASIDGHLTPEYRLPSPQQMTPGVDGGVPNTVIRFRFDDGTPYPREINGQTSSDWMLDYLDPADPQSPLVWKPYP